jgi:hypothetical protein
MIATGLAILSVPPEANLVGDTQPVCDRAI